MLKKLTLPWMLFLMIILALAVVVTPVYALGGMSVNPEYQTVHQINPTGSWTTYSAGKNCVDPVDNKVYYGDGWAETAYGLPPCTGIIWNHLFPSLPQTFTQYWYWRPI